MNDSHKQINMVKPLPNIPSFLLLPAQFPSLSAPPADCLTGKWKNSSLEETRRGRVLCTLSHLPEL